MAKLPRVTQKVFGDTGDASHYGEFGSRAAGSPFFTKDPAVIQALTAFTNNGWKEAINSANKAAFLEDLNGLFRLVFYQLAQVFQDGQPVWDPGTTYYTGSVVRKDGTFELYGSLTDSNLNNALPNQTDNGFWHFLNPPTQQPGIIVDFGGGSTPFGYLLCDGSIYAQAAQPNLYAAIGSTWNTYRGASDPGGGNFRVPDLRGQTTIGAGAASGLSPRTLATFVGEETHVLVTGEMPNHNHPASVSGGTIAGTSTAIIPGASAGAFLPVGVGAISVSIGFTGGGGAHNNMQPSAVVTKVIKT